jgi:outer membrane lipopolysaccharide assembly protein LptE/RlpB
MQARELTPQELAEGSRGITDRQLTATEVQALVRTMDASKTKWASLRRQGKQAEYETHVRAENEMLYFNYPSLFDMHIHDKLDGTLFEMLALKRKIERGDITAEEASRIVGQTLFTRFVPHAIDSATPAPGVPLRYEDFYRETTPHTGRSTPAPPE